MFSGDFKLFDTSGQSPASPGSKCYKRYKNIDGLCVPENPDQEFYYSSPQNFLEDFNDLRREYANRFNVPNMHELVRHTLLTHMFSFFKDLERESSEHKEF